MVLLAGDAEVPEEVTERVFDEFAVFVEPLLTEDAVVDFAIAHCEAEATGFLSDEEALDELAHHEGVRELLFLERLAARKPGVAESGLVGEGRAVRWKLRRGEKSDGAGVSAQTVKVGELADERRVVRNDVPADL